VIQKCETNEFQNELMRIVTGTPKKDPEPDTDFHCREVAEDEMYEPHQRPSSWGWLFGEARLPPQQPDSSLDEKTDNLSPQLCEQLCSTRDEILRETEEKLSQQRTDLECQMMERITSLEDQLKVNSEYITDLVRELEATQKQQVKKMETLQEDVEGNHSDIKGLVRDLEEAEEWTGLQLKANQDELNSVKIKHPEHWHIPTENLTGNGFPARLLRIDKDDNVYSHLGHYLGYTNNVYGKYYSKGKFDQAKHEKHRQVFGKEAQELITYYPKMAYTPPGGGGGVQRNGKDYSPMEQPGQWTVGCSHTLSAEFHGAFGLNPAPLTEIHFSELVKKLSHNERCYYIEYGVLPSKYEQFATGPAGEWADMKAERMIMERERKERIFSDNLAVGDRVYYKRTKEYVEVIEIHKEDPEETYYTLLLPDGKERQTNISNITAERLA
jgi:hypothetical protein